jgi:hypothetical protein
MIGRHYCAVMTKCTDSLLLVVRGKVVIALGCQHNHVFVPLQGGAAHALEDLDRCLHEGGRQDAIPDQRRALWQAKVDVTE